MKLNGIGEQDHKIFGEIERNRNFIKKIKDSETALDESMASRTVDGEPQKRLKLDTAAAMRMVKPYLNQDRSGSQGKFLGKQQTPIEEVSTSVRPAVE